MEAKSIFSIWDTPDKVYGQMLGTQIDDSRVVPDTLAKVSSQVVYEMYKNFKKSMLSKFNIEQLMSLKLLVEEVIEENSDTYKDALPEFKSYGLTTEQTFEVVENYVEYHCRLAREMLQEACNDSLNMKTAKSYMNDLDILLKFKDINSTLLYRRFMED